MNLNTVVFENPLSDWLTALGIALAINVIVGLLRWSITHHLARFFRQSNKTFDDSLIRIVQRTKQWLVFAVTLYIGVNYLELPRRIDLVLKVVATVGAFLQIGLWAATALDLWINRTRKRANGVDPSAATSLAALSFIAKTVLWAMVLLLTLDNLGVNVTALVAGLGVGGIAVALAVQNILGDLFASLSIIIDKPFVIGDFIIIDDFKGTVEHVGLKTTRLRSLSGEQLIFSNSDLLKSRLRNYKRMQERRIEFRFGVLYKTTPDQLAWIAKEVCRIVNAQPLARCDRSHFQGFGDSSLDFEVVYWMSDPDYNKYMDTQQAINLAMMRSFAEKNIEFAYPTRTVIVEGPVKVGTSTA